jgi:hypothetical protein
MKEKENWRLDERQGKLETDEEKENWRHNFIRITGDKMKDKDSYGHRER